MQNTYKKIIYLLAGLNVLNFTDRYIISAVAPSMQTELGFTDAELGMIGTAFLWGFVLTSPFVGGLLRRFAPQWVLAAAVIFWSAATAASGVVSILFAMLALRAIIGIGQAVFSTAGPPIIDTLSAKNWKTSAISYYFAAMPVGISLGFIAGGFMDMAIGWRMSFILAGAIGIPVALLLHRYPIKKNNINQKNKNKLLALSLLHHPVYLATVFGNILQGFALAGFAFWAPIYFSRVLNYPAAEGSIIFGVIFLVTGISGTFFGGWLVKLFAKNHNRSSLMALIVYLMLPAAMAAFVAIAASSAFWFFVVMAFVQFLLFATYTPFSLAFFKTIPPYLKETANGVNMFFGRLFGDMLGIWLVGYLSIVFGSLALAMYLLPFMLILASLIWWLSAKLVETSF